MYHPCEVPCIYLPNLRVRQVAMSAILVFGVWVYKIIILIFCTELTYTQISFIAHEAESHPELIPDLIEVLGCNQKDDPKYKELKGGKLMMQMIMDWEKAYNAKSQEEGSRRALARKLYEKSIELKRQALSTDHDKRTKAIQRMANNLDIYFDPEALS